MAASTEHSMYEFNGSPNTVDAVIPVYGERAEALDATLRACCQQSHQFQKIIIVDDGSPRPVTLPTWAESAPNISLLRLPQNRGISGARNYGIAHCHAPFLACINVEVLPDPDWLVTCIEYLLLRPQV